VAIEDVEDTEEVIEREGVTEVEEIEEAIGVVEEIEEAIEVVEEIEVAKEELVLPFKKVTAQEVTHVSFLMKLVVVAQEEEEGKKKSVKTSKWEDVLEILVDSSMKVQVAQVQAEVVKDQEAAAAAEEAVFVLPFKRETAQEEILADSVTEKVAEEIKVMANFNSLPEEMVDGDQVHKLHQQMAGQMHHNRQSLHLEVGTRVNK